MRFKRNSAAEVAQFGHPGAQVRGVRGELILAIMVAQQVYAELAPNVQFVVTSCTDGTHSIGSEHYLGNAVDFRITPDAALNKRIRDEIDARLTANEFDVILESNHLHIEFDPKLPLNRAK